MPNLVYIIEDDDFFYSLEHEILTDFKFNIKRFASFNELTKKYSKTEKPIIAIVDYFLVNQFSKSENGLLAVNFLKQKFPDIKIIVVSAQIQPEITYDFIFKYKVNAYINKDKNALIQLKLEIEKLLE